MFKKAIQLLLNPLIVSLGVSIIIWIITPNYFPKYKADLIYHHSLKSKKSYVNFEDVNNDGISELITAQENFEGFASFEVRRLNNEIIDQWNFDTFYSQETGNLEFFDLNNNGVKEFYSVTTNKDSIFLNVLEPFNNDKFKQRKVLIDFAAIHNEKYTIHGITKLQNSELNKNELFFNLNSGYSGYPRNLYKYNIVTNKISKSPHLTNTFSLNSTKSIDNREFVFQYSVAPFNDLDTIYTKRSDYSSWLTILDNNLEFVFDPIEIGFPYKTLHSIPYKMEGKDIILTLANSTNDELFKDKLNVYSIQGDLLDQHLFTEGVHLLNIDKNTNKPLILNNRNGKFNSYSKNLSLENEFVLYPMEGFLQLDLNNDGIFEGILQRPKFEYAYEIYDNNFKNPITIELPTNHGDYINIGTIINNELINFFVKKNNNVYLYKYYKNDYYIFNYLKFPIIYFIFFGLFWLVLKGYKINLEKKAAIEKEISELQLMTINNQLNPHFVFNSINTISEMMLTDNKLEADDFICKFSDLMRSTLRKSDSITTTLDEELTYVENYILLQQIRFKHQFGYTISIGENVDTKIKVPKHIIHSYVENAIKHGLATKRGGVLKITINKENNLTITIEDNGAGIGLSKVYSKNSTGNGILIMEKMYDLYAKLYNKKIHHDIKNIIDVEGTIKGVKVVITVVN